MARTPRNTLSAELIVRTALELMEGKGTDALSLRGVAAELGVGPMALYTYFRNCRSLRLLMLQHPCLAQLLAGRPLSGHETARVAEGLLGVLRAAGFDPQTAARTHTTLFTYVLGATSWEIQMAAERRDPDSWRRLRTTMESLSAREFPSVVELAPELARTTGGDEQFDYGLDLLLAGLQVRRPS